MPERITTQLLLVLEALTSTPEKEWYGVELMDITKLSSGTLYPLLHRLVADGWLVRTREAPSEIGGTSRRLYKLTGVGAQRADATLASRRPGHGRRAARPRLGVQPA